MSEVTKNINAEKIQGNLAVNSLSAYTTTTTTNFRMISGATTGYVLTAIDNDGNAAWQPATGSSGGTGVDTYVTGFTYNNANKLTISQNQGQTPLDVFINTMTGLTVNGNVLVNGTLSASTFYNTTNGYITNLTATTMFVDWIDFNQNASVPTANGRISWDSGTGTLNIGVGSSTTATIDLQVGQEEIVRVYNSEATTLTKGTVVYVSGSQGNRPAVKRAIATNDGYSVTTLGIVDANITSGAEGYVTTFGIISNLDTTGYSGGTAIWLSPYSAGTFTATKPIAPDHTVLLGYVVRVDNNVGSVFVNISNGWEIDELHDVRISGSTVGDLLVKGSYNGSPVWVNSKTLTGDYLINGNLNITGTTISNVLSATTVYTTSLGVSGNCVTDAYIGNLHGCSPITVHDSIQSIGSSATGTTSFAFGSGVSALGNYSHAEGESTLASGLSSHAEGAGTTTSGDYSHAEGGGTQAIGNYSHAEGLSTYTGQYFYTTIGVSYGVIILDSTYGDVSGDFGGNGIILEYSGTFTWYEIDVNNPPYFDGSKTIITLVNTGITAGTNVGVPGVFQPTGANVLLGNVYSHAEGESTITIGGGSHAEGYYTQAIGDYSHAEGTGTQSIGLYSHAEGNGTQSIGQYSHAEGNGTQAIGQYSHAEGNGTQAIGPVSHAEGAGTTTSGSYSHAEGAGTTTSGDYSHAEGSNTTAIGEASHAEGIGTESNGIGSHAEGYQTQAIGNYSHAEGGQKTLASGDYSHAEGGDTTTVGHYSHAEGRLTTTTGIYSHTEGYGTSTSAKGSYSHAEGFGSQAIEIGSHAEGYYTQTAGDYSHSQGAFTITVGNYSFASGSGSTAQGDLSFVHSINSIATGVNTVILGGQNITGTTSNMVYVSDLNINSTPTNNNSATQILVRNSSTGDVEYRDVSTISGTTQPIAQFATITGGTLVSGTTNNTISQSLLIPANSRTAGQVPTITFGVRKSGGSNTHQPRLYWNTGVTLTNAILVASNAAHAAATQSSFTIRDLSILVADGTGSGTNLYSTISNANSPYGVVSAQPSNIAINWTVDGYFIVAITNASGSDSSNSLFISLK